MVNFIWLFFILAGFLVAAVNGRIEAVTEAVFEGAKTGVTVCFGLISVMVFWLGMMRIAEDAGLLGKLAALLHPVVSRLFPSVPRDHPAFGYILSNMSANLLGLGNAATPAGIKAMEELQKLNPEKDRATAAMCTLLAINTASITLIPTTMIAVKMNFGSANPTDIVGPTLAATAVSLAAALWLDRRYQKRAGARKRPPGPPRPPGGGPESGGGRSGGGSGSGSGGAGGNGSSGGNGSGSGGGSGINGAGGGP